MTILTVFCDDALRQNRHRTRVYKNGVNEKAQSTRPNSCF